jgi:hypothetical protein
MRGKETEKMSKLNEVTSRKRPETHIHRQMFDEATRKKEGKQHKNTTQQKNSSISSKQNVSRHTKKK